MNVSLLTVVLGLFGGIGGTLLWEGLLGPFRRRRNVARAISAEVSTNLQLIAGQLRYSATDAKGIPGDFSLSLIAFNAIAEGVAELPSEALRSVLLFYSHVIYLNDLVRAWGQTLKEFRATPLEDSNRQTLKGELDSGLEAFHRILAKALETGRQAQDRVFPVGEAWRFKKQKMKFLKVETVDEQVEALQERRAENLKRMKEAK